MADPGYWWAGPRQDLVRRLVRHRLPPRSLVVDASWRPGSPLEGLGDDHRALAVATPDVTVGIGGAGQAPTVAARADVGRLPLAAESVDGVLLVDVLERLADDRAPVAEAARVLRPGGLLLAATPAGPRLWSVHDEIAGHRRRYTVDGLVGLVTGVGLVPERVHRFQCLLYPFFAASRRWAGHRPGAMAREPQLPTWLADALAAVNSAEVAVCRRVPWPWGTSLVVLARKP